MLQKETCKNIVELLCFIKIVRTYVEERLQWKRVREISVHTFVCPREPSTLWRFWDANFF